MNKLNGEQIACTGYTLAWCATLIICTYLWCSVIKHSHEQDTKQVEIQHPK